MLAVDEGCNEEDASEVCDLLCGALGDSGEQGRKGLSGGSLSPHMLPKANRGTFTSGAISIVTMRVEGVWAMSTYEYI